MQATYKDRCKSCWVLEQAKIHTPLSIFLFAELMSHAVWVWFEGKQSVRVSVNQDVHIYDVIKLI